MGERRLAAWCAARVHAHRRSNRAHGACRFDPSCSAYALDALATRRLATALVMIGSRLLRCNPLARRVAHDPVARPAGLAPRPNTVRTAAAVLALGGAAVLLTPGAAVSDDITGGCTGAVNGRDATSLTREDPLRVGEGGTLTATGEVPPDFGPQNPQSLTTVEIEILAGLIGVTSDPRVSNGPAYTSGPVELDDYLRFGAGLYRVKVVNRGQGWRCQYTGYVELDTDPLGSPVGLAAATGVVVGAAGIVLAKGVKRAPTREWIDELVDPADKVERDAALRTTRIDNPDIEMVEEAGYQPIGPPGCLTALALPLPAMPLFGAGGGGGGGGAGGAGGRGFAAAPRAQRVVWSRTVFKRGHPVWGGLAGFLLGLGAGMLLWQYSVWLLSLWTVAVLPVAVALLAALYAWSGRRYRARVVVTGSERGADERGGR